MAAVRVKSLLDVLVVNANIPQKRHLEQGGHTRSDEYTKTETKIQKNNVMRDSVESELQ